MPDGREMVKLLGMLVAEVDEDADQLGDLHAKRKADEFGERLIIGTAVHGVPIQS